MFQLREKGLLMKKTPRVYEFATTEIPLRVFYRKKGFIPRLIMRINAFFSDQRI